MGTGVTLGVSGWRLHGQRTGVGRYLLNLIQHWTPEVARPHFDGITVYSPTEFEGDQVVYPQGVSHRVAGPSMPMVAWENLRLGPFATESVMLYPSYSRPFISRGATVVVTHDATMRLHPELFTKRDKQIYDPLYGWSARSSTQVITTTEAAKGDIAREWHVDPSRIHVTHLAPASCFKPLPSAVDRSELRRKLTGGDVPYFLFVGKLSGRRNLPRLIEAFVEFRRSFDLPHRLVLVGPRQAIAALETMASEFGVLDQLVTKTFVPDDELNELYNCAHALIMPSTYETVSFPIMEAQAAGIPVICIDTPGSREMTGGEALLISKLEVPEIVDAMKRIATDDSLWASLASRGLANASRFSWTRCAESTLQVCATAAAMNRRNAQ